MCNSKRQKRSVRQEELLGTDTGGTSKRPSRATPAIYSYSPTLFDNLATLNWNPN